MGVLFGGEGLWEGVTSCSKKIVEKLEGKFSKRIHEEKGKKKGNQISELDWSVRFKWPTIAMM